MAESFDFIVIGGGPGGYTAAIRAAQAGMKVALVEQQNLGGACLNRGCIPTKTLVHTARQYRELFEGMIAGIRVDGLRCDRAALFARKDTVVNELRDGIAFLLKSNNVALYNARGCLMADHRVLLSDDLGELTGQYILLATGAQPIRPNIPGAQLPDVLTSDELLAGQAGDCKRLCIIGGGVIGTEIASVYADLGCTVTILEAAERILPTADREISQNLSMILKKRGLSIHTGSVVQEISQQADGLLLQFTDKKGEPGEVSCDKVLLSVGRKARLDGLWEASLPIQTARGIVVDDHFETTLPGVFAIGDCIDGGIQLAHVASAQASCAVAHMAGEVPDMALTVVPGCIYTDPEIAWVGLSTDEAKARGIAVKTGKYIMSGNGKSLIEGQERGFVKLVFDAETEVLLGAQLMCGRATDLIGELTGAIATRQTAHELARVIRPHPTFLEGVSEAVEDLFSRAVHIAPKKKAKQS